MGDYSRTFADNPYQRAIRTSIFFIVRAVHRLRTYRTHFHLTLLNLPQLALDSGGRVLTLCLLASRLDTFLSFFRFSSSFSPLSPLVRGPLLSTHTHTLSLWSHQNSSPSHRPSFSLSIHLRLSHNSCQDRPHFIGPTASRTPADRQLNFPFSLASPNIEIFFYPYTWPLERPSSILFQSTIRPARPAEQQPNSTSLDTPSR